MKEPEIYDQIIKKWGLTSQLGMLQEECAELIVAVNKYFRQGIPRLDDAITEELADVQNMVNQFKPFCPDFEKVRLEKLERVAKSLA